MTLSKIHLVSAVACSSESTKLYNSNLRFCSSDQSANYSYNYNCFILIDSQEEFYLKMKVYFRQLLLILQCKITFTGSENSVSPIPASVYSVSGIQNLSNHTECPMWFNYSSATNDCQC